MSLPPYTDEKAPLAADVEAGVVVDNDNNKGPIEDDTELQVGGERQRCALSRRKKFLIGAVAAGTFLAVNSCAKRHMGGMHELDVFDESFGDAFHPGFQPGPPRPGLEFHEFDGTEGAEPFHRIPATYRPSIVEMNSDGQVWQTANASLPMRRRPLSVQFADAADGRVVVSRADGDSASVYVESTWEGTGPASGVEQALGETDYLFVNGGQGTHVVHLVLPAESKGIKDLSVSGANVRLELHSTAADVKFKHLSVHASGNVHLPDVVAKAVEIESPTGDIKGHFNVSRHLALRTVTGNIDATVHVRPHHHHKDHDHDGHKDHDHDKDDDGHHHKHGPHHGDDHHHKHGGGERALATRPCSEKKRGLLAWISANHHEHHPKRPPFRLPVFIRATSVSGDVELTVKKAPWVSTHTVARSSTGNVKLVGGKAFHGYFRAAARVGKAKVKAGEKKEIKYFHERESETGKFVDGIVKFNHTHHDHPKHPDHGDEVMALHHHGDKHHHKHGSKHGDKHHHKHEHGFVPAFVRERLHGLEQYRRFGIAAWRPLDGDEDHPDHPRHRRPPPGVSGAIAFTEVGDVELDL